MVYNNQSHYILHEQDPHHNTQPEGYVRKRTHYTRKESKTKCWLQLVFSYFNLLSKSAKSLFYLPSQASAVTGIKPEQDFQSDRWADATLTRLHTMDGQVYSPET
jgi:hypothetical protein